MAEEEKQVQAPAPTSISDPDRELKAIGEIVAALKPLDEEERTRVLEYVLGRFGVVALQTSAVPIASPAAPMQQDIHVQDIRSLKEAKRPKSANEMAALVAYYVSELVPTGERKNSIGKADIEKYFKNAGFPLPADANFTLVNAKNAGYLDGVGGGQYKINPVGYNLVTHRMGGEGKKGKK